MVSNNRPDDVPREIKPSHRTMGWEGNEGAGIVGCSVYRQKAPGEEFLVRPFLNLQKWHQCTLLPRRQVLHQLAFGPFARLSHPNWQPGSHDVSPHPPAHFAECGIVAYYGRCIPRRLLSKKNQCVGKGSWIERGSAPFEPSLTPMDLFYYFFFLLSSPSTSLRP